MELPELARYALEIFPKEIWEMIILKVKDAEDLRNLMKASKQLNNSFFKIRHLWLLDKVLPILTTATNKYECYLEEYDLMKLRLVDKRWNGSVNTFLENQPTLRPYNEDDDKLNSEAHIWSGRSYRDESTIGTVTLKNDYDEDQLREWNLNDDMSEAFEALEEFGKSGSNPFLSRCITRYPEQDGEEISFLGELKQDISERLGNHVWFLEMAWAEDKKYLRGGRFIRSNCKPSSAWKWILHSIKYLPNLKSLNLKIKYPIGFLLEKMSDSEAKEFLELEENQLPPSSFLESLRINQFDLFPDLFSQRLMSQYCLQLRRIQISAVVWESREKWSFPNLTELCLDNIKENAKVSEILMSLKAPQLAKLRLEGYGSRYELRMEDVLKWIKLFPALLYLDLSCRRFSITESGSLEPPNDSHCLKYLKIHNSSGVSYNFLRCLKSLQRLQINVDAEPVVWDCSEYPEVKIKLEIETNSIYESNVWEVCPKLRSLSLYTDYYVDDIYYDEFDRETYEKLKNRKDVPKEVKLRPEIHAFLELDSEEDSDEKIMQVLRLRSRLRKQKRLGGSEFRDYFEEEEEEEEEIEYFGYDEEEEEGDEEEDEEGDEKESEGTSDEDLSELLGESSDEDSEGVNEEEDEDED